MLHVRFGDVPDTREGDSAGLAAFQADALRRIRAILDRRGGAILADSVGLGKTHVARTVIREARGEHVLVCGPAALRSHWRRHLRSIAGCEWLSHTALSRGSAPHRSAALVVVDEAHAFRNPATWSTSTPPKLVTLS